MIRYDVEDHQRATSVQNLGWALFYPAAFLIVSFAVASGLLLRVWYRICLRCPHHKVEHDGKCEMGEYRGWNTNCYSFADWVKAGRPANFFPPGGPGPKWEYPDDMIWCKCPGFIGLPWGKGDRTRTVGLR